MINAIVFDKDGTLFDFNATWGVWAHGMLMSEAKGDPELLAKLADVLGYDLEQNVFMPGSLVIASTVAELADAVLTVVPGNRAEMIDRMNVAASDVPQMEPVPLLPFLSELRDKSFKLGVATNDAEAPARQHLRRAGVEQVFDFIAGYDSGFGGKPAPGQLLAFCEAVNVTPDRCVMVGDSLHDLRAGRAAGMQTVGVLTGPAPHR